MLKIYKCLLGFVVVVVIIITTTYLNSYNSVQILGYLIRKVTLNHIVKLTTVVKGDHKAPFSIATTPRCVCVGGRYSFPGIAPLYP